MRTSSTCHDVTNLGRIRLCMSIGPRSFVTSVAVFVSFRLGGDVVLVRNLWNRCTYCSILVNGMPSSHR